VAHSRLFVDVKAPQSLRGFSVFTKCVGKLNTVGTASTSNKNNIECRWWHSAISLSKPLWSTHSAVYKWRPWETEGAFITMQTMLAVSCILLAAQCTRINRQSSTSITITLIPTHSSLRQFSASYIIDESRMNQ